MTQPDYIQKLNEITQAKQDSLRNFNSESRMLRILNNKLNSGNISTESSSSLGKRTFDSIDS